MSIYFLIAILGLMGISQGQAREPGLSESTSIYSVDPIDFIQGSRGSSLVNSDPESKPGPVPRLITRPTKITTTSTVVATSSSTTEFPDDINSTKMMSFGQAVILAKEEAKCVGAFGSQEEKTAPSSSSNWAPLEKLAKPYGCYKLETLAQCKQCKNVTERPVSAPEQCREFCNQPETTNPKICNSTCFNLYSELENKSSLYDATYAIQERLNEYNYNSTTTGAGENNDANDNIIINTAIAVQTITQLQSEHIPRDFLQSMEVLHGRRRGTVFTEAIVFCEGVYPEEASYAREHIVVLRWKVEKKRRHSLEGSPLIYVVEQKEGNMSDPGLEWKTVGKTPSGLYTVNVLYRTSTYRWRITAVGTQGIEDVIETEEYTTLDGYKHPGQPKRIYVVDTALNSLSNVNVLIGWDPPDENTCYFKIVLDGMTGKRSKAARIYEPIGIHQYWFGNLSFGKIYHVLITSRDRSLNYESRPAIMEFKTPSCLESFSFRFDRCAPPQVSDITADLKRIESGTPGESVLQAELAWKPPMNASETNPIEKYVVEVTSFSLSRDMMFKDKSFETMNFTLLGNVTKLTLKNLTKDTHYTVMITAYSIRGPSPQAQFQLNTKMMFTAQLTKEVTPANWIYVTVTLSAAAILLLLCNVARVWVHKRKVKMARNQYFQSMEERDASAPDWSIVPLTEDSSNWKLFDENFPKDKWEISWDDLTMDKVIGQGAFGVVRRAKVGRKKLEQKLKQRGEESWLNSPDRNFDEDDPENETVAVKMVKVSSTRDDREQLIREITMMQNLGFHGQIVGLLGACTKGRTLCLVLEYCPGGDLLTFVRKVRAKYWPTLGLAANSSSSPFDPKNRRTFGMTFCGSGSGGIKSNSQGSEEKRKDSVEASGDAESESPINYADIGGFSESCSSPEQDNTSWPGFTETETGKCNTLAPDAENSGTKLCNSVSGGHSSRTNDSLPPFFPDINPLPEEMDDGEEFRPIDERDVLSYARQIAMGMEYLEKNRVVHRDLACRNVLLMGDYKHVKISDFGLSRDIYTWNVYHQKSNGKLPIKWMAIESIFTHVFTTKSDVWSYGILLWELLTLGGTPYPGLGNTELFQLLKSGYRMERPENCSQELYAVMKKCWRAAAASRPSFTELRKHVETMMEAAEPNLYLSLQADIPVDFYQLNSRADLHLLGREDEFGCTSPLTDLPLSYTPSVMSSQRTNSIAGTSRSASSRRKTRPHHSYLNTTSNPGDMSPVSGGIGSWNGSLVGEGDLDENEVQRRLLERRTSDDYEMPISYRGRSHSNSNSLSHGTSNPTYSKCTFLHEASANLQSHDTPDGNEVEMNVLERKHSPELHSPDSGILMNPKRSVGDGDADAEEETELSPKQGESEEFYDCSQSQNSKSSSPSTRPPQPPPRISPRGSKASYSHSVHPKQGTVHSNESSSSNQGKRPSRLTLPFINVNDMTIIENRTYDLTDS